MSNHPINKPCVVIVDDDQAMCDSMKFLIESIGLCANTYTRAQTFLDAFTPDDVDCLLLDIRMPEYSGIEIQSILKQRDIDVPIIFITSHDDVSVAVKAMKAGALDFILKPFNEQKLLDLINKAIQLNEKNRTAKQNIKSLRGRYDLLSPREREVLELVMLGTLNKHIATQLGISTKTVELHRANIMRKMQVGSLAELVKVVMLLKDMAQDVLATLTLQPQATSS